jgi:hypothetical protein
MEDYMKKLRKHFDVKENPIEDLLSDGFQPFYLS